MVSRLFLRSGKSARWIIRCTTPSESSDGASELFFPPPEQVAQDETPGDGSAGMEKGVGSKGVVKACMEKAKADRETVYQTLLRSKVQSKKYFYPPVHVQTAFRDKPHRVVGELPNSWALSRSSLALPLFAHMTDEQQDRVCRVVEGVLG